MPSGEDSSVIAQLMNSMTPNIDNITLRKKYESMVLAENEFEQNWHCDICLDGEEDEDLVICDLCLVVVHPSCHRRELYKSAPNEKDAWHCERCRFIREHELKGLNMAAPACMLCPDRKGAMI